MKRALTFLLAAVLLLSCSPIAYAQGRYGREYYVPDTEAQRFRDYDEHLLFEALNELYCKFVAKGIPVLLDEFGALDKNGNHSARADYAGFFVANARARGMTCFWWDNNITAGDGMRFGLIDRASLSWVYPDIVEAMMRGAGTL